MKDELDLWELEVNELRAFLSSVLEKAHVSGDEGAALAPFVRIWNQYLEAKHQRRADQVRRQQHVHLVFGQSDAGSMKVALSHIGRRLESRVLAFSDLFSVGPLGQLDEEAGQRRRWEWISRRFDYYGYHIHPNQEHQIGPMADTLARLPEDKRITIWYGDNAHDQVGLRFAMHVLRDRRRPVHAVNITEAFTGIAGRFGGKPYPLTVGMTDLEALQEILERCQGDEPLSDEARRRYEHEWQELSEREGNLRLWQDGAIRTVPEDRLDADLLAIVKKLQDSQGGDGFVRAGRVAGEAMDRWNQVIGDSYVQYRLWTLIGEGRLEFRGMPGALYKFSVRHPERAQAKARKVSFMV
ncbi:DUF1835 domain-containing protein [Paenibacillus sp. P26]|nr:DUF1835 domain-containing protein [Paenibacillus sp. P26]